MGQLFLALALATCVSAAAVQGQTRMPPPLRVPRLVSGAPHPATIEEILALREVTGLALAPNGRRVAFALRQARPDYDAYASAIFVVDLDRRGSTKPAAAKLADISDVAALEWQPDGRAVTWIAPANGVRQVWRVPADGTRPQLITSHPTGVGTGLLTEHLTEFPPYAFSPDGRYVAYFTWDTAAAVRQARRRSGAPFVYDEAQAQSALDALRPPTWREIWLRPDLWLREPRTGHAELIWRSPARCISTPPMVRQRCLRNSRGRPTAVLSRSCTGPPGNRAVGSHGTSASTLSPIDPSDRS
jgi:hypothetical protein